jgi:hypothetical protein
VTDIQRELTRAERSAIQKLVKDLCANYDNKYGCLILDGACYMFYGVAFTNTGLCKYFREAVLPTDPLMEAMLTGGGNMETRRCAICGEPFPASGRQAYCSDVCAGRAQRRQQREHMRKKRHGS